MELRDYQTKGVNDTFDYIGKNPNKNPCLEMPTGAGKSIVIAEMVRRIVQVWLGKVLMLTHVKELIEQNYEKLKTIWPSAPAGIYSASVGRKELDQPITFAGIQSIAKKAKRVGHIDIVIIDECHLVSHKDEGGYRNFINDLKSINKNLVVIGLTATPYRSGHGLITDEPALFSDIIKPVTIEELISRGYLSILRSKHTNHLINVDGVKKRGGEYIEQQLQLAVNTDDNNIKIVEETIARAENRKAWLFFCAGVAHAEEMARLLNDKGINTACITGKQTKRQRERILEQYKIGYYKAVTNANILTTGFDYPDIDLIVFARPTLSVNLYVQMAGRGMRIKSHTDHCLVLDFAAVVERHGPITCVNLPRKKGERTQDAPMKRCHECDELLHLSIMRCYSCGYEFPKQEEPPVVLHNIDIMGIEPQTMEITRWRWDTHISKTSGNNMIKVSYYGQLGEKPIQEYFAIENEGIGGNMAVMKLERLCRQIHANGVFQVPNLEAMAKYLNQFNPPTEIEVIKDGRYKKVTKRYFETETNYSCA